MTPSELFGLKERMLKELLEETKESDFQNYQEYQSHLFSAQEGIMTFYSHTMTHILDTDEILPKRKTA
jgi:hypothetical protein